VALRTRVARDGGCILILWGCRRGRSVFVHEFVRDSVLRHHHHLGVLRSVVPLGRGLGAVRQYLSVQLRERETRHGIAHRPHLPSSGGQRRESQHQGTCSASLTARGGAALSLQHRCIRRPVVRKDREEETHVPITGPQGHQGYGARNRCLPALQVRASRRADIGHRP
jgi:hypothetical protein